MKSIKLNALKHFVGAMLAFGITATACTPALAQEVLRISAIPDEAPTELQRKFKPLGEYLSKETGMKVEFTPVTDYAAVVEALATKKIDMAWLGGFTYVQTNSAILKNYSFIL
jgi:phosphonate transport system substrate-binding protein